MISTEKPSNELLQALYQIKGYGQGWDAATDKACNLFCTFCPRCNNALLKGLLGCNKEKCSKLNNFRKSMDE